RTGPASDARQERLNAETEQLGELVADASQQLAVVELEQLGLQSAADEGAQQHELRRRATGILQTAERAGEQGAAFDVRNADPEPVRGVRAVRAADRKWEDPRRCIGNPHQLVGKQGIDVMQHSRRAVRRQRDDYTVALEVPVDPPAVRSPFELPYRLAE